MKTSAHILNELTTEIERLKTKNRNYRTTVRHLTTAYERVRLRNCELTLKLGLTETVTAPALKIVG